MPGFGYGAAGFDFAKQYYNALAFAGYGGVYGWPSAAQGQGSSSGSHFASGEGGGSASLLEELKAKQAARDEHKQLREQIEECGWANPMQLSVLQQQLALVEQRLGSMGVPVVDGTQSHSSYISFLREERAKFRLPEDGSNDQFGRLCHALTSLLQSCEGQTCRLHKATEERRVHQEWSDLIQSGLVSRATKLKHVLLERPSQFKLYDDADGQPCVRIAGKYGSGSLLSLPGADTAGGSGSTLSPEQANALGAYIKKAGGSERVSRLMSLFDVDEGQLKSHFPIYEDGGRIYATTVASATAMASLAPSAAKGDEIRGLEARLKELTPARGSVCEAMHFCLQCSAQHAAPLARGLIRALEDPDLETEAAVARLYLVSDVLHNSSSGAQGAARFRTSFEELLPDAFERMGRQWFRSLRWGRPEWRRAEGALRRVMHAWSQWCIFPPLYVKGLECLVFEPINRPVPPEEEPDAELRKKLSRWCSAAHAANMSYAARVRGLSGSALATSACVARLCHYERYWHIPGVIDPLEDAWAEDIPPEPLSRIDSGNTNSDDVDGASIIDAEVDGDPLDSEDLELCEAMLDAEPVSQATVTLL